MLQHIPVEAALLTPEGRGAVATIGLRGPGVRASVAQYFRAGGARSLEATSAGEIRVGRWRAADGEEIVVSLASAEEVAIHCHGGRAAAQAILHDLAALGCRLIDWQTWIAADSPNLVAHEARLALAEATTERTALVLLDQFQGALLRAATEIDALAAEQTGSSCTAARARLERLQSLAPLAAHLTAPWRVAVAGPPNVGKSSLINALVGFERSIVYDRPGTTRDVVTVNTAIDGWPVELWDTAGLRASSDPLEAAGVDRAVQALAECDLLLLVFDASQPRNEAAAVLAARYPQAVFVRNKIDLCSSSDSNSNFVSTSALHGKGIELLLATIAVRLVPAPPARGEAVPFAPRHLRAMEEARAALDDPARCCQLHAALTGQAAS